MLVMIHLTYFWTGNIMFGLWVMYMGRSIYDRFILDDSTNISKKYEKAFSDYSSFKLPLYAYVLTHFCCWVYYLMLFSGQYQDYFIF